MFKPSAQLRLENIALRHQLIVLRRSAPKRLKLTGSGSSLLGLVGASQEGLEISPDDRQA